MVFRQEHSRDVVGAGVEAGNAANRTAIDDLYEIACNFRVEPEYTFM
jgi:hypothetical protein